MTIKGVVEKIIYRNADNGYTVMVVSQKGKTLTCVGTLQYIGEGEYVSLEGEMYVHPIYEEQLVISSCEIQSPEDETAILRYLSSGAIKGVGAKLADRIVSTFGEDTFRVIEEEPERLSKVRGISERMAMEISAQLEEKKDMRSAMMFLQKYGISSALAIKIYNHYGKNLYKVIESNPYKMAEDIQGIGFKIADEIAAKAGIEPDSVFRIRSGILHVLTLAAANGHTCMPVTSIKKHVEDILQVQLSEIEEYLVDMVIDKVIVVKEFSDVKYVYSRNSYFTELSVAHKLAELDVSEGINEKKVIENILKIEDREGITLDEVQQAAVVTAAAGGVLVITGGPGTGKTTTINCIIKYFEEKGMDILLAAPTGRAAKRMSETTGYEALTIHRLLGVSGNPEDSGNDIFDRNEDNPLEADVIIIDEMSMVDIFLMNSLLKAVVPGTGLILVGDVNQLPSVGPGKVLKDIIESQCFNVVELVKIYRQSEDSDIVANAHMINRGEQIDLNKRSRDFFLTRRYDAESVMKSVVETLGEKMPKYVGSDRFEIQVLSPMRKGYLGVENLNEVLQRILNPPGTNKRERELESRVLREGDKVMQTKNNYQLEWEVRGKYGIVADAGKGVYNGDMGIIRSINTYTDTLEVEFDDGRMVTYSNEEMSDLELAYAITIHKSQGSEYPAVIIPLLKGPQMLMNRNLLYTAVTRAKKCVCIIGTEQAVTDMINNKVENTRYSGLRVQIENIYKRDEE